MRTHSPQKHRGTKKNEAMRNAFFHACIVSIFSVFLYLGDSAFAVQATAESLPGKLFYTPAQRAMLIDARKHPVSASAKRYDEAAESAPLSFDGMVRRSDGVATHWINGRPHVGKSSADVHNLKPGQTRAAQKVYEPYQVQRSSSPPSRPPLPTTPRTHPTLPEEPLP